MRLAPRSLAGGALACLLLVHSAFACQMTPRATVPIERAGGLMLVSVAVNGVALPFILDTGAERSVLGTQAAAGLSLARDEWVSTDIQGIGGRERQRLGRPASLSLGGVALRRRTVAADTSIVVGTLPTEVAGRPVAGLLGQDFLSAFDLDLDQVRLTLYDVAGCSGDFLPWRQPYAAIAAVRPVRNILAVPVRVAGRLLQAELDSGAERSVVLVPGMLRLGLPTPRGEQVRGFGPNSVNGQLQPFEVQVGSQAAAPMTLLLMEARGLRSIDMLLGADWLGSRHVWISWATNQLLVERQGSALHPQGTGGPLTPPH